jgi:flagellar hook-basal body complex protein FliE
MPIPITGAGIAPAGGLGSPAPSIGKAPSGASFGDTLNGMLNQVSDEQDNAQQIMSAYLRGDQVEVHQVMAASEEAGIALEMLVEIRNKLTEAYRTVINMQS